ncbi:MAG: response regulator [Prevotellaceae bacterium]|jgi:ligand-binding sensor domain-containing protein/signal transduction histidine kinase/DNA-binding response OmpR family regulator|nr:response regulator [Prevotellaceae bacterium]
MNTLKKCSVFILTLLLCLSGSRPLLAQTGKFYSIEKGLSSSLINSIYQDSKGFIWITGEYGLNRFDGVKFKVYHPVPHDSTSLNNNYTRSIFESRHHRLFIGSIAGLMEYDWGCDCFRTIPLIREGAAVQAHVMDIIETAHGAIWITTSGHGLFSLQPGGLAAHYETDISAALSSNYLNDIFEDSYGDIWIGTEHDGLNRYTPASRQVKIFRAPAGISGNIISSIAEDRHSNLFVGTLTKGLNRYDRQRECFIPVRDNGHSRLIISLRVNNNNQLLVGTDGQGLKYYNEQHNAVEDFEIGSVPFDFTKSKVHAILQDREGGLWLGLFQKGVVYIPNVQNKFDYYGYKSVTHNLIGSSCVMSIFKGRDNILWIGTDNDGLYGIDEQTLKTVHFSHTPSPRSVPSIVLCVFEDSEGNLWIGSYANGLAKVNRQTGECQYIAPLANEKVYYISEDRQKRLLVGTFGAGLFIMDIRSGALQHYESSKREENDLRANELGNDWINYILCDHEGLIWLGHYRGLSCFDPEQKTFLRYQYNNLLPDNIVNALCEDRHGAIWVGTTMHLYRFDKATGKMEHIPLQSKPVDDMIYGIVEDRAGNIWVSAYKGIYMLDPATREVTYYAGDGLQGNEFMRGAVFKDKKGKLYFGGTNGVATFYPHELDESAKELQVHLTGFYLFNQPVRQGDRSGRGEITGTPIFDAEAFQLAHKDNTFTMEFSTLDFVSPEQTAYEYRMEGLQPEWTTTAQGMNQITYNNLPPGNYIFMVRVDGYPGSQKNIRLTIRPPWYQTWWAKGIYVLLLLGLAGAIVAFVRSRIHYRHEMLKKKHAEEINEARLQFFINISHEIRTPMTLIINPIEKLIAAKSDPQTHAIYLIIYRNAQRILRLINQLMDIRKIDKGQMRIGARETDMVGFISDLMHTFEYIAQQKHIRFVFETPFEQLKVWVDVGNFDKVMLNVLSNAFKSTPGQGEIIVRLTTGSGDARLGMNDYFEIRVIDSGIGVETEHIERIFDRFYQVPTGAQTGTGVGLHLARQLVELHHGVIYADKRGDGRQGVQFIIRMPMGNAHLRPEELETPEAAAIRIAMYNNEESRTLNNEITQEQEPTHLSKSKTKYKILIVEDEDELREYMAAELSTFFRVTACNDGKQAWELALSNAFDAIVSDIMMPVMDGITLTRKVKQNININHTPVILLTAKTQNADQIEGLEMGADAYLSKPFNTHILITTISNLIANREILRNKFSGNQNYEGRITLPPMKSSDEVFMNKVLKTVNENLSNTELNVELLAGRVGMSRVHMHRKLKELTSQSAGDFIRGIRLKQAALMLSEKKITVSEVAYAAGFRNLSHFSTTFKDFYGISPTEYIRSTENGQHYEAGGLK